MRQLEQSYKLSIIRDFRRQSIGGRTHLTNNRKILERSSNVEQKTALIETTRVAIWMLVIYPAIQTVQTPSNTPLSKVLTEMARRLKSEVKALKKTKPRNLVSNSMPSSPSVIRILYSLHPL